MKYLCTYFDYNFMSRGLALYESIEKHCEDFTFFVLALDEKSECFLKALKKINVVPIGLDEYITYFGIDVNQYKDKKQFYFSITPNLCLYILRKYKGIDILFYIDADIYFFGPVEKLYDEISDNSIAICPQRINKLYSLVARHYGTYNVGINGFRNDEIGLRCLEDWQSDCSSWYPEKPGYPLSFFSDQIFLDTWPQRYERLKIIKHIGINTAPWNLLNYRVERSKNAWVVNNTPLIAFHFSSLKKIGANVWDTELSKYLVRLNKRIAGLYKDYIRHIESFELQNKNVEKLMFRSKSMTLQGFAKRLLGDELTVEN